MESVVRTSMTQFVFSWNTIPNVGFAGCKVKRVVNLFEDTGSVRELNYLAKIPIVFLVLYGRIKASSIINYVQMLSLTL
jgi:hypothetical protein